MSKGKRLETLIINSRHRNINQFSKATDIPYTTIKSLIERNLERASIDSVVKIAKSLNVTVEYLIGEDVNIEEVPSSHYNYYPLSISAGIPVTTDAITDAEKISIPDVIMGKYAGSEDIYITRINGESMNKIMPDQSLIAVKPTNTSQLKDDDIVVYNYDNEYAVKRFYQQDDKVIFKPDSTDSSFFDQVINSNNGIDLKIKGKVVLYIVELD